MILFLYAARRAAGAFLGALSVVVGIFLAVDFVDQAQSYVGPGWARLVIELYANKAAVIVHQVAPAAMVLGAAIAVSTFRQTREYTAMRAVGLGPWRLAAPVLAVAFLGAASVMALHDLVGVRAAERAEEIQALRFGRESDKRRYAAAREPKRWFRSLDGHRIYNLRGSLPDGGFERVTILEVTDRFGLARRIDAARMHPEGGGWILDDVEDRTFHPGGELTLETAERRRYRFDEPPGAFAILAGRPSQMRFAELTEQIGLRRRLGLAVAELELERQSRFAHSLAAVPGALLALALALRRDRTGHVSAALLESVGVTLLFWGAEGVTWALGLSGRVAPWLAVWVPNAIFLAAGALAVRRTG